MNELEIMNYKPRKNQKLYFRKPTAYKPLKYSEYNYEGIVEKVDKTICYYRRSDNEISMFIWRFKESNDNHVLNEYFKWEN